MLGFSVKLTEFPGPNMQIEKRMNAIANSRCLFDIVFPPTSPYFASYYLLSTTLHALGPLTNSDKNRVEDITLTLPRRAINDLPINNKSAR